MNLYLTNRCFVQRLRTLTFTRTSIFDVDCDKNYLCCLIALNVGLFQKIVDWYMFIDYYYYYYYYYYYCTD